MSELHKNVSFWHLDISWYHLNITQFLPLPRRRGGHDLTAALHGLCPQQHWHLHLYPFTSQPNLLGVALGASRTQPSLEEAAGVNHQQNTNFLSMMFSYGSVERCVILSSNRFSPQNLALIVLLEVHLRSATIILYLLCISAPRSRFAICVTIQLVFCN